VRRPLAVLLVGTALLAAGCGGNSKRHAVAAYINRVNAVEKKLAVPLAEVTSVNQSFARAKKDPKLDAQLAQAERTMETLRRDLSQLKPPPEAEHLHALLLQLVDREVALTHEVLQLATFVPSFQAALRPLAAADASLKTELGRTVKGAAATKALDKEKSVALETYATTVDAVIATLHGLDPPPVWKPGYDVQLSSLVELRSSALALAEAVRTKRVAAVPKLLRRFDAAAVADQSTAVQKQQIAAVKAYDDRIKNVLVLGRKIQFERGRLQRVYG
jgi:hypothetical protein